MNNTNLLHKVNKFLARELFHNVKDVVIFQTHPDGYEFFNKYHVIKERDLYKTYSKYESQIHHFTSLKLAMAWCIFKNQNRYDRFRQLERLNQLLIGYDSSIDIHKHLIRKTKNLENKLVYVAKLIDTKSKKSRTMKELQTCLDESDRLQTKKFASK